jgi:hypothetical protein
LSLLDWLGKPNPVLKLIRWLAGDQWGAAVLISGLFGSTDENRFEEVDLLVEGAKKLDRRQAQPFITIVSWSCLSQSDEAEWSWA